MQIRTLTTTALRLAKQSPPTASTKYLGRPSNNLSAGLVGLANVGKSTFFQAITKSSLGNPANYPYATIEPEKSIVQVPSRKLDHYQRIYKSQKKVPTNLTVWDIAGLTRNSSSGAGLGNKFLNDIRQVDGILQIIRGFMDDEIIHIEENKVDPVRDLVIVNDELILKDLEFIEVEMEKSTKNLKKPNQTHEARNLELLEKLSDCLYNGVKVINGVWTDEEIDYINGLNLLTAKPTVYLLNVSKSDYIAGTNQFWGRVQEWITTNSGNDKLIMFSAEYEHALITGEPQDKESIVPAVIQEMRDSLHLISFYTCGDIESRQWTLRKGSLAPDAAGLIHTDLQKTFINSIVYKWDDLAQLEVFDENKLKSMGKQYRNGKKYEVEDGDVLVIKAGSGKAR
ncbi:GTP-binding protein YchF [Candida parapsilosis]|uniref:Obg-like ATPase homolog n=1 Tax=Candida parapsilosis TaxID=5480 RepID=A0A8X7NMJ7_CANPA|nr:GTP-binding protein YchF [Candida parapsilosis]KAF6046292.1 GTP-binding protein YchF [Candida parapsilosis]KAF6051267.1 GTP-binding protein YchF [Candida parapsilosis]KAF6062010.1 GTP-binding protein YchF [Candida parapsilosis]KAI5906022.1 Obg-like ATPase [Candida parapsilosis]